MWELDYKDSWAQKNWCFWTVVLEKTFKSPLDCNEIQPVRPKGKLAVIVHWKDWCWSLNANILATWWEELTHLKTPWCWESLKAGEGDDGGWDGLMASLTQWTWVWVNSWSWWWTGRPGVLQSMGSERVRHDWVTELNWTERWRGIWVKHWVFSMTFAFFKKLTISLFLIKVTDSLFSNLLLFIVSISFRHLQLFLIPSVQKLHSISNQYITYDKFKNV